jgi:hypothetical protein
MLLVLPRDIILAGELAMNTPIQRLLKARRAKARIRARLIRLARQP